MSHLWRGNAVISYFPECMWQKVVRARRRGAAFYRRHGRNSSMCTDKHMFASDWCNLFSGSAITCGSPPQWEMIEMKYYSFLLFAAFRTDLQNDFNIELHSNVEWKSAMNLTVPFPSCFPERACVSPVLSQSITNIRSTYLLSFYFPLFSFAGWKRLNKLCNI